ncbi:MAG TPA: peptidase dimerization domain-containing protein, partial [Candidatus Dormibacteraeota bacterium]|nr:peptidase dimerization domain-containing protein [Candidatus Dormibacteraeota bacterium]
NEAGAVSLEVGEHRLYPIAVAEKGYAVYRIRVRGAWGHGSMPRPDNAIVRSAAVIERLAAPGARRLTPVMATFFETAAEALGGDTATILRALAGEDASRAEATLERLCAPSYARAARALVRDTISPNVIHAGVKYNVIPGEALIELDCRLLPGTTEPQMRTEIERRLGADLLGVCDIELVTAAVPVVTSADSDLFRVLARAVVDHDPGGIPLPVMATFATDAKTLMRLDVPSFGFSPMRVGNDPTYLERYHGVDERVSIEGLRWGLPVLYDAVRRFCA